MTADRAPAFRSVIVFAKAPVPGDVKTRLLRAIPVAAVAPLARAFLLDALETALAVPDAEVTLAFSPAGEGPAMEALVSAAFGRRARVRFEPQRGRDLGQRMAAAVEAACARGATAAVIIGSDSPTLPACRIEQAFATLEGTADLVLGPAEDGGYYLLGARRPLPAGMLDRIAWSSGRERAETEARACAAGLDVALLEAWYDVDGPADLERLRRELLAGTAAAPRTLEALKRLDLLEPARPHGV